MRPGDRGPGTGNRAASAAAAVLAVLMLAGACAKPAVPTRLGGLVRSKVLTGGRAARKIAALHGREVAPRTSVVAEYGRSGALHLYVSEFAGPAAAQRAMTAMLAGLHSGRLSFHAPQRDDLRPDRWFTVGPGGHHVLWVSGSRVYWLAGYPGLFDGAMAQLPAPSHGEWT